MKHHEHQIHLRFSGKLLSFPRGLQIKAPLKIKRNSFFCFITFFLLTYTSQVFAQENSTTQELLDQVKALQKNIATPTQPQAAPPPAPAGVPNVAAPPPVAVNGPAALPNLASPNVANPSSTIASNTTATNVQRPQIIEAPQPAPTSVSPKNRFISPFQSQMIAQSPEDAALAQNAFTGAVHSILPMSPEQIHRLRQLYSAAQYAAAAPAGIPPRPTATSLFVDLSPGAAPPAINLAEGDITAIVFLDSTGAPWPIDAIDNGNPSAFDIQWNKKDNVLLVQATSPFGRGNIAIRLKQLGPPVMMTMMTNSTMQGAGGVVDYRVDLRVPGFGPNANPVTGNNLPGHPTPLLLNVLDGIPPDGSKALDLSDDAGQAWLLNDSIYLRTRLTLLSPAWVSTMSSADGTHAYQLQKTPLLLMSEHGKVIQIKLKGF